MKYRLIISGKYAVGIQAVSATDTHYLAFDNTLPVEIKETDELVDSFEEANKRYQEDLKKRLEETSEED